MYYGRSDRGVVSFIATVCAILCTVFFMVSTAFLSLYFFVCTPRLMVKICEEQSVAQSMSITDEQLAKNVRNMVSAIKKGTELENIQEGNFFDATIVDDATIATIIALSPKVILARRLSLGMVFVAIALFIVVLAESRARILRNVFVVAWGAITIGLIGFMTYTYMNPEYMYSSIFDRAAKANLQMGTFFSNVINVEFMKNAVLLEIIVFLIFQILFLLIINHFTVKKS